MVAIRGGFHSASRMVADFENEGSRKEKLLVSKTARDTSFGRKSVHLCKLTSMQSRSVQIQGQWRRDGMHVTNNPSLTCELTAL